MATRSQVLTPPAYEPAEPLGVVAGSGALPRRVIAARRQAGLPVFVIALEGYAAPETVADVPHRWCRISAVGEAMLALHEQGVEQLVLAGGIDKRPLLRDLYPDATGRRLLRALGGRLLAGDDRLLRRITAFLGEHGFRVVAPEAVCAGLLADDGVMTMAQPDEEMQRDRALGVSVLRALGAYDIGQSIVVYAEHIVGIEAMEGTASLIERCRALKPGPGGVLVKMPKSHQCAEVDRPALGLETVEALTRGAYRGLCMAANETLMLDKAAMIEAANRHGLVIEGFERTDGRVPAPAPSPAR